MRFLRFFFVRVICSLAFLLILNTVSHAGDINETIRNELKDAQTSIAIIKKINAMNDEKRVSFLEELTHLVVTESVTAEEAEKVLYILVYFKNKESSIKLLEFMRHHPNHAFNDDIVMLLLRIDTSPPIVQGLETYVLAHAETVSDVALSDMLSELSQIGESSKKSLFILLNNEAIRERLTESTIVRLFLRAGVFEPVQQWIADDLTAEPEYQEPDMRWFLFSGLLFRMEHFRKNGGRIPEETLRFVEDTKKIFFKALNEEPPDSSLQDEMVGVLHGLLYAEQPSPLNTLIRMTKSPVPDVAQEAHEALKSLGLAVLDTPQEEGEIEAENAPPTNQESQPPRAEPPRE